MKIISKAECQEWLSANLGKDLTPKTVEAEYPHCVHYRLPIDTGRKTALGRALTSWAVDATEPGLFWITGWSVWPSAENLPLFYAYRKSLGEDRWIIDAPGHIFTPSDSEQLDCLVGLSLYFFWDGSLFDGSGTIVARWNHDEFLSIYAKTEDRLQAVKTGFENYKLDEVDSPRLRLKPKNENEGPAGKLC